MTRASVAHASGRITYGDHVFDVEQTTAGETRRRQRRDVDDVVQPSAVAGLDLAAGDPEDVGRAGSRTSVGVTSRDLTRINAPFYVKLKVKHVLD